MENQLDDDALPSPFSAALCSSYQLPKEEDGEDMVDSCDAIRGVYGTSLFLFL